MEKLRKVIKLKNLNKFKWRMQKHTSLILLVLCLSVFKNRSDRGHTILTKKTIVKVKKG